MAFPRYRWQALVSGYVVFMGSNMIVMPQSFSIAKPNAQKSILYAGFTAGTLDILAAFVYYYSKTGNNPTVILKYIASAAFGGNAVLIWGLVFHYMIAFSFTTFFFLIYPRLKFLSANKWLTSIGYGLFAWAVMNLLVLPMSQIPKTQFQLSNAIINAIILICMIGLPITLIIGNYFAGTEEE
jgi:magnesium-transporting ATPase (P-type)